VSLLVLSQQQRDPRLTSMLATMRTAMQALWRRMVEVSFVDRRSPHVFLINQYDLVLSVMEERAIVAGTEWQQFRESERASVTSFIEEELDVHWHLLTSFVRQLNVADDVLAPSPIGSSRTASNLSSSSQRTPGTPLGERLEAIGKEFSVSYTKRIAQMYHDMLANFSNFRVGSDIFKQALTQLALYYTRFEEAARQQFGRPTPPWLISINALKYEFQKYATRTDFS
jgi:hypothetical protein